MRNKVITLSNKLALSIPQLSTQESRLLYRILYNMSYEIKLENDVYGVGTGNLTTAFNSETLYSLNIPLRIFKEYFTSNVTKNQICNYLHKLQSITVQVNYIDDELGEVAYFNSLFKGIYYYSDVDMVQITFNNAIYQNVGDIVKEFTLLELDEINKLKTGIGRKLYILLRVHEGHNYNVLMTKDDFDKYFDFVGVETTNQNKLIQRGINDLEKQLGVTVKMTKIKKGNKVTQVNISCNGLKKLYNAEPLFRNKN
ncbi:initiator replication protein [Clostridium homopropionicum DSM 5847]|jgi:plasmid replication initiation protein|uniref:Initiator replication protein n=1 Tax=Clostridium homopropionicum DSM 5847 TaxID=1121318 RepID=A0A0L6ZC63_9CLOT|nr:replication initiation protein [Clostridium homopropionicum]KOA20574.1 initiator replication protein [Clostridium homopropionicum DSM 5847]SFG39391.1 Initiator Replication protein [Clostridium homopropionicum]